MHIVHVANFYGPGSGGVRTFMHALARGYSESGHQMTIIVPGTAFADETMPHARRITVPGKRIAWSGGYRMITDMRRLQQLLTELNPERLEVSDRLTLRGLGQWAKKHNIPSINIAHERVDGVLQAHLKLPRATAAWLADKHNTGTAAAFDHIVATTAFAALEFDRIQASNVVRIPLGTDLVRFHPRNFDAETRAGYLEHPDEKLLVLASRLSTEKRPDLAINALRELRRRGCRARLVSVGTGPARVENAMRRLATGLPVMFAGFVPQFPTLASLMASADVVLAPGPIETFGLAALETLASGTPVVGSRTSALAEIITPQAGAIADPDPIALADAVESILGRPEAQRRAGARARAQEFDWDNTVRQFLELHGAQAPRTVIELPRDGAHQAPEPGFNNPDRHDGIQFSTD